MKGNIFIKRPVMAISISIVILLVGFISLISLPVEQYPDIALLLWWLKLHITVYRHL